MEMRRDMAASAQHGPADLLYASSVPDTTFFRYDRDTPLMPMLSPQGMIQERLPAGAFMVGGWVGLGGLGRACE